jgi:hypothetical protein
MRLINFIFQLLATFVQFENDDYAKYKADADKWYSEIQYTDGIKGKAKQFMDKWYAAIGLAVLFIIMKREISDYLNPDVDRRKDLRDED